MRRVCGHQFDDLRGNEEEYKDILDVIAPKKDGDRPNPKPAGKKGPQLEICFNCVHQIRSSTTTPAAAPAPSPMPVETPATTTTTNSSVQTTARSSASANAADVSAAAAPLPSSTASAAKKSNGGGVVDLTADAPKKKKSKQTKLKPPSGGKRKEKPPKPRKERTNYSIQKRLEILEYKAKYGGGPAVRKYKCSRQNLSYWEQQKAEYLNVVNHSGNKNRIVKNDPLLRIKIGISAFYELNKTMPKDCQINITGEVISARAIVIRDRLLEIHAESNFLTDHEVTQMKKCTFSQSWSNKLARSNGWKSKKLHGEAGSVDVDKAAPEIERICTLIAEYDLDHVYNMDETGLFFKCLPNRSYLKKEDYKNARGNKLMKAKDRVTVYVCTNADGSDKVPLAMIGKSKEPRCFLRRQKKLTYYSQRRAWSDTVTFHKWWRMFLHHIRRRTTKKVLLILDNCGPHGDELIDPEGQVTVVFLPPNCTSMFQPMDAGVIAMLKKNYRTQLLLIMLQTFDDREHRRSQAKGMAAGTKGLDEGHHPHLRDAMDILYKVWEEVKPEAVKKCWIKSQLIGRDDITSLSAIAPGNDSVDSEAVADAATTTDADGDVNMEPEVVAAAGDDSETSDGDDAEMERLYELANQFAKDNNDRQRCLDNMSDYDVMINELVMTMKSTPPEDAQKMMRDWIFLALVMMNRAVYFYPGHTSTYPRKIPL